MPLRLEPQLEGIISRFQSSMKQSRSSREEKSKSLVDEFGQLQRVRVQNVLLVCTDYDSYTFEEEGLLNELVYHSELSKPPVIDRVSSPELGLQRFKERGDYDMVVTLARMTVKSNFVDEIMRHAPGTPIALLALNPSELVSLGPQIDASLRLNVNKREFWDSTHGDDGKALAAAASKTGGAALGGAPEAAASDAWVWPFMWQGRSELFTAIFKAVEDRVSAPQPRACSSQPRACSWHAHSHRDVQGGRGPGAMAHQRSAREWHAHSRRGRHVRSQRSVQCDVELPVHGQPPLTRTCTCILLSRAARVCVACTQLNVKYDVEAGVQTILLVEDSVQFYSSYLPLLYSELCGPELTPTLNPEH